MWFKLAAANFSAKNLGKMSDLESSYKVTSEMTGLRITSLSSTKYTNKGDSVAVTGTITVNSGYKFANGSKITNKSGTTIFTATKDYAANESFNLSMNITADVILLGTATVVTSSGGNTGGGGSEGSEPETPVNPPVNPPSSGGDLTSKSLTEIKQSLQMYCAKDTAETSPDSVIAPDGVTENADSIQIAPSKPWDRCYFSNIPLTPGSEVEITITPSSNSNPNYCIGFESDISTGSWASKNWKADTTGITIPESHLWVMTKADKNDDNKLAYLQRLTGKFQNATPAAVTSTLEGTDGRYTLKVLSNGFEAYKNGVKVYTMTSEESNPYLTHTATPVYFCFATATLLGIKIHSIKVA